MQPNNRLTFCALMAVATTMVFAGTGMCATYYIDFALGSDSSPGMSKSAPWRRAPGMSGFAGAYTHAPGDQFIFKGGVTWDKTIAPWRISNGGSSNGGAGTNCANGSVSTALCDYYGVDKTWYSGSSWSQPLFDGGSQYPVAVTPYWYITGNYVTIDNLRLQHIGVPGINQGNYAIYTPNNHDVLIENCTLAVMSRIAIEIGNNNTGGPLKNLEFRNNDISQCSWGIGGGAGGAGSVYTNIRIHHNTFHDFHWQLANNAHGDAIYLFTDGASTTSYLDQVYVYNNVFYGDFSPSDDSATGMGAYFRIDSPQGTWYVYNNRSSRSAGTPAYAYMANGSKWPFQCSGNLYLYNNSDSGGEMYFVDASQLRSLIVENNISIGAQRIYVLGVYGSYPLIATFISDYNDYYGWTVGFASNHGTYYGTYASFKASGYEVHGMSSNPLFVTPTDAGSGADLRLQATSPARGRGVSLSSLFTAVTNVTPGPLTGAWDMGAYQPTAPPTGLQAIVR